MIVMSPPAIACLPVWLYSKLFGAKYIIDAHTAAFVDPRWRARETYDVASPDGFTETFELAAPGKELAVPALRVSVRWSAHDVLRFVRTWSGVQSYIAATKKDPVAQIATAVQDVFGGHDSILEVSWPLYIRAARQQ